jgi:signal peptidase II
MKKGFGGLSSFTLWIVLAGVIIGLDQITKWMILKWVPLYDKIPINSFINVTHQRNTGAAFSFLADAGGWQRWFFVGLATIVSAVIVTWLWRIRTARQVILSAGLSLVLAGALGNVIDRIRLGYVVDFVQVYVSFLPFQWLNPFPSFNVADSAITVGAALLIIDALLLSGHGEKDPTPTN